MVIPPKQLSSDKPKVVDASELFKLPHKASRPDHIVILLRGLPGKLDQIHAIQLMFLPFFLFNCWSACNN